MTSQRVVASDADGAFRIDGLEAAAIEVVAIDPAMRTSGDADASAINEMFEYMKLATAEVVEGEVTTTVLLGAPPSDPVEVSGRVTQGGEPYAQAMVNWLPASTGVQEKMKFTTTDADGRYSLTLDEAGDYMQRRQAPRGSDAAGRGGVRGASRRGHRGPPTGHRDPRRAATGAASSARTASRSAPRGSR